MEKEEAPQVDQHELTDQTARDLIGLIPDKKLEVRKGALSIILQFTNNSPLNSRRFLELAVLPQLIKHAFTPEISVLCLTNLINFSSLIVDGDEFSEEITQQFVKTAQPILLQLKEWTGLEKELALLYLTNLSKLEKVSVGVIVGDGQSKGYFMGLLASELDKSVHVCNILANISSFKEGREFLTSDDAAFTCRLQKMLFSSSRDARVATIRVLRNCLFEFENEKFVDGLLEADRHFIDNFGAYLGGLLVRGQHLLPNAADRQQLAHKLKDFEPLYQNLVFPATSQAAAEIAEVQLATECLLIMNNIDMAAKKPTFLKEQFREVIDQLLRLPLKQQVKDKLQFVQVFFS